MSHPDQRRRPATYQDLLEVPDHFVAEILNGDLHVSPRPAPRQADASSGLGGALRGPFDRGRGGPGGWRILDEPELHLGPDVVVPDLGGWRRERLPHLPDQAFFSLAPDWVCEVVSPLTAAIDRVQKLGIYLRESVQHVWLVDPIAQTLRSPADRAVPLDDRLDACGPGRDPPRTIRRAGHRPHAAMGRARAFVTDVSRSQVSVLAASRTDR